MNTVAAFRLTVLGLLVSQPLGADPAKGTYPKLQNLNNLQQEALQREQKSYDGQLSAPTTDQDRQRLNQQLERQKTHQRQLQYQHRNKAIADQRRARSLPDNPARNSTPGHLRKFRREQESQRLQFKLQRRSWPLR